MIAIGNSTPNDPQRLPFMLMIGVWKIDDKAADLTAKQTAVCHAERVDTASIKKAKITVKEIDTLYTALGVKAMLTQTFIGLN